MNTTQSPKTIMLGTHLPPEMHQQVRMAAARSQLTMSKWLKRAIDKALQEAAQEKEQDHVSTS